MISKLGNISLNFAELIARVNSMDYFQSVDYLDNEAETFSNLSKYYTNDKMQNFKYKSAELTNMVPDSVLESLGFDSSFKTVIITKQPPGSFVAPHTDKFKSAAIKDRDVTRLWIPLTDGDFGQALFVGEDILHRFQAGDVYTFPANLLHSSANAGTTDRYVLILYTTRR